MLYYLRYDICNSMEWNPMCIPHWQSRLVVQVKGGEMESQWVRQSSHSSAARVDGVGSYCPLSGDTSAMLLLLEDGSLQVTHL